MNSPGSLSHDCVFNPKSIEMQEIFDLKLNTLEGGRLGNFNADMINLRQESLIYTITNKLTVTAYSYDEKEIKKLRKYDLQTDNLINNVDSRASFAISHDESSLYVFSIYGAWQIDPKSILEKMYYVCLIQKTFRSAIQHGCL
jgi:hypothetical protein